ncbi:MAG: ABC transporter ATP-binding protein [Caldilineaceae bacterium]|nr:ABC transporter ATP-binding protein [Caldilineaceae bacterium]
MLNVNNEQNNTLLEIKDLKTYFHLREGISKAVDGASFSIRRGKTLGVVGESGCGKSVTAQSILQIVPKPGRIVSGAINLYVPDGDAGTKHIRITDLKPQSDQMRAIRGSLISMIFQEPMTSFSPVHTIGNQLAETIHLHQPNLDSVSQEMVEEMMRHVGIANPERNREAYPHQLSGGMRQRAMIAMALMLKPSLLIADEPTTALDVTTEAQILRLMRAMQAELGMAIMFITHDLGVIAEMADDVVVMYLGRVVESGDVFTIFDNPQHPYLRALMASLPRIGVKSGQRLAAIEGMVPNPLDIPTGCPFHPRCPEFMPGRCDQIVPREIITEPGHMVACHLYDE